MLVTCEKTGITFEAASKRTKNHPQIMSLLTEANRNGWYHQALEAIKQGREQGFTTIEQFLAAMRESEQGAKQIRYTQIDERNQQKRALEEARRQRHITNTFLREHGYHWEKYENDEEDQDFFGAPAVEWDLWSPDNHIVSVKEAMQQLASQQIAFAQKWLEEHTK